MLLIAMAAKHRQYIVKTSSNRNQRKTSFAVSNRLESISLYFIDHMLCFIANCNSILRITQKSNCFYRLLSLPFLYAK